MHLPQHQEMLRNAGMYGGIDAVIEVIKRKNGEALHVETGERETLSQRVFFHQPNTPVPYRGYVTDKSVATLHTRDEHMKRLEAHRAGGTSAASRSNENTNEARELAADAV